MPWRSLLALRLGCVRNYMNENWVNDIMIMTLDKVMEVAYVQNPSNMGRGQKDDSELLIRRQQ